MRARAALVLLVVGVVVGVLGTVGPLATPVASSGCATGRSAVAHHPGGVRIAHYHGTRPVPCAYPTGYPAFESTIGITPSGTVVFSPVTDFHSPTDSVGIARSTDRGGHWSDVVPKLAGVLPFHVPADPYLYVDPTTGRIFFATLQQPAQCGQDLSWSDDDGATWGHSVVGCPPLFDQETIFAGPPRTSHPRGYPNVVYDCAMTFIVTIGPADGCMRSLDGGRTFSFAGVPFPLLEGAHRHCNGPTGFGRVGPDGTVYLAKGLCRQPYLAISHDEGRTWDRVRVSNLGTPDNQEHLASVAVDRGGNVYVAWIALDHLPYLAVSRDGGYRWGRPMMVGAPGVREASIVQVAAGATGRVALTYMGSSTPPGSSQAFDAYLAESTNALGSNPTFLSAAVNDPHDPIWRGCAPPRCNVSPLTRVDYVDVEIGPDGTPWAGLVDACTGSCVGGGKNTPIVGLVGRLSGGPNLLR